jgi:hypothetical protein
MEYRDLLQFFCTARRFRLVFPEPLQITYYLSKRWPVDENRLRLYFKPVQSLSVFSRGRLQRPLIKDRR